MKMTMVRWIILVLILSALALGYASCSALAGDAQMSEADPARAIGWKKELIVEGLEHPWAMVWLPDGSILVTERPGRIRRIVDGRLLESPIANVPTVLNSGQGGLLDISLHPRFAENSLVYISYAAGVESKNKTVISRGKLVGDRLEEVEKIYETAHDKVGGQHFGSRFVWLDDRSFVVSIGDGGNPPSSLKGELIRNFAQDKSTSVGKVLRLLDDGTPHPENPFVGEKGSLPEVYSFGHRNIQGMALEPKTGRVWANEHGARGGDELNIIMPGENYGWPLATYSREYWGPRISENTSLPGMRDPVLYWTPSKAPSGLTFYSGAKMPRWKSNLFSGALKFSEVRRLVIEGDKVVHEEVLDIGERVRDVREGPDGFLYVLTDMPNGKLFRIVPGV